PRHPTSTLLPYTTLFRSNPGINLITHHRFFPIAPTPSTPAEKFVYHGQAVQVDLCRQAFDGLRCIRITRQGYYSLSERRPDSCPDRKSTRLNSSHRTISY